jgi:hypothetical protein
MTLPRNLLADIGTMSLLLGYRRVMSLARE